MSIDNRGAMDIKLQADITYYTTWLPTVLRSMPMNKKSTQELNITNTAHRKIKFTTHKTIQTSNTGDLREKLSNVTTGIKSDETSFTNSMLASISETHDNSSANKNHGHALRLTTHGRPMFSEPMEPTPRPAAITLGNHSSIANMSAQKSRQSPRLNPDRYYLFTFSSFSHEQFIWVKYPYHITTGLNPKNVRTSKSTTNNLQMTHHCLLAYHNTYLISPHSC
jgi:hypothetical protein